MRLLITGASGSVGKVLLKELGGRHDIVCLGRSSIEGYHSVHVDISDSDSVMRAAQGLEGDFDALIHLAAHVPKEASDDTIRLAAAVNVGGTINILEAFRGRVEKLIIGSSMEVYDQGRIDGPLTEDSPVGPASYYASTKLASEFIAQSFAKKNNIPITVLRFSVIYGIYDPIQRALPNFIRKALRDQKLEVSGRKIYRDYIHIADVVQSIKLAIDSSAQGVFNIGTGQAISVDKAALDIIAATASSSEVEVGNQPGVSIVIDPRHAEDRLGFKARIIFPEGLEDMVNQYRSRT